MEGEIVLEDRKLLEGDLLIRFSSKVGEEGIIRGSLVLFGNALSFSVSCLVLLLFLWNLEERVRRQNGWRPKSTVVHESESIAPLMLMSWSIFKIKN